ncbi:MAG TPA: BON domain-containing protein [Gemmatimonadales bacterium]|jgi:osmotically-inducible protein OsmY
MTRQERRSAENSERRRGERRQQRPDESVAREINEILSEDPELEAGEIEVQVEGGAVTLIGTVDSSDAKFLAEELIESVAGVREVHNRLRVEN